MRALVLQVNIHATTVGAIGIGKVWQIQFDQMRIGRTRKISFDRIHGTGDPRPIKMIVVVVVYPVVGSGPGRGGRKTSSCSSGAVPPAVHHHRTRSKDWQRHRQSSCPHRCPHRCLDHFRGHKLLSSFDFSFRLSLSQEVRNFVDSCHINPTVASTLARSNR